jgi:V/A-type H+-transporting ATPase subunit F
VKKIVAITPPDAAHGFALAGITQLVREPQELSATLRQLTDDAATGVVILDERIVSASAQETIQHIERRWPGLIVVLPAPGIKPGAGEDFVSSLIRRAIGYQVRLSR